LCSGSSCQRKKRHLGLARPEVVGLGVGKDGPSDPIRRVLHEELERRRAVVGPDEVRLGNPERIHEPLQHDHVLGETVIVGETDLRVAEAEQIGCDDPVVAGKHGDHVSPLVGVERASVEQEYRRAAAFVDVGDVPGSDRHVLLAPRELLHRALVRLRDEGFATRAFLGSSRSHPDEGEHETERKQESLHDHPPGAPEELPV
jgi:hypothetical protein